MNNLRKGLLAGGAAMCAIAPQAANAQGLCTAGDQSYVQTSDCSTTTWTLGASWSDGIGGSGSSSNIAQQSGSSICVSEHTACNGSTVSFHLYPATESFTWETSPYDNEQVEFYWSIGNEQDSTNNCASGEYDETVFVGYYTFTGWYGEWCN